MAAKEEGGGSFARRDDLLKYQKSARTKWDTEKVFEVDAPAEGTLSADQKWWGNFPYPYMNGQLHLGHAFSLSKLEFATAYQRLIGKTTLFAQGFHCTGMPIKASADKIKYEIAQFGNPPVFPKPVQKSEEQLAEAQAEAEANEAAKDPSKYKGKKSKTAAKTDSAVLWQWQILEGLGIPSEEIHKFADPEHWLYYFPPIAMEDISAMGCGVDWRRAFITTDVNPYYDAFIQWQFRTLLSLGKIVKDKRLAVYSPKDGQPCADHDRASGEGVGPQEYVLIKMRVLELTGKLAELEGKGPVFLLCATLRPETMYGQTNCWALPSGAYSAYRAPGGEVFVMTLRSAMNLSYQEGLAGPVGQPECLLELTGQDLIGTPLKAPNTPNPVIYVLPLLTILMNKGTGIVSSVPSDSPDDYAALADLKKKDKLREKFGVKDEWVMPFQIIPVIHIPGFGDAAAEKVCADLKITSQNDTKLLAEAKGMVYLKGFTDGVMLASCGPYSGQKVSDAKPKIKEDLVGRGDAILYSEPERSVTSRSGDECVVALTDQWYLCYGETEWREQTEGLLASMEVYGEETRHGFEHTLGWLNQWACSRNFGLGTRVPWDPQYLIESLSDSTIYMAFYTVAHILQGGDIFGKKPTEIKASQMTDQVWDHIFLDKPLVGECGISKELLQRMRQEFNFWYPWNLRVSGKDLIQNHLTFSLYTHTAIFPKDKWPLGIRTNGHLLLNSVKMSKSTGNFKTLKQAIEEYGADAMRVALADAGDHMEDANFEETTANAAILKLTRELAFISEALQAENGLRTEGELLFADRVFDNAMNICVVEAGRAFSGMMFRTALQSGWYALLNARDAYRLATGEQGMRKDLVHRFIDVQVRILAPICPHTCEHIWGTLLGRAGTVLTAGWPEAGEPDFVLLRADTYLQRQTEELRKVKAKAEAPPKKAKKTDAPPPKMTHLDVYVEERFGGWQVAVLNTLRDSYDPSKNAFPDDVSARALAAVKGDETAAAMPEKQLKQTVLPFVRYKMEEAIKGGGAQVLDVKLPFSEEELLTQNVAYLCRALEISSVSVSKWTPEVAPERKPANPGEPLVLFKP